MPRYTNPAEFIIELVNTDFVQDEEEAQQHLEAMYLAWEKSEHASAINIAIEQEAAGESAEQHDNAAPLGRSALAVPFTLTHRNLIKAYRDIIAYGIRIAMYIGLAIMMGTIWLRLKPVQVNIGNWINSIFFGGAFLSFMAVAYIPAFIEDLNIYKKERANGLYGPTAFMVSNFVTGEFLHSDDGPISKHASIHAH